MLRHSLSMALVVLTALILTGCGPSKDPVKALLDDVVAAAEDRDAQAVAELLADDVEAGGMDKSALSGTLRQYLAAYQALDVALSDVKSVQRAGSARVTFTARLTGVPKTFGSLGDLVPKNAAYDFELVLRETPAGWLISQISWQER